MERWGGGVVGWWGGGGCVLSPRYAPVDTQAGTQHTTAYTPDTRGIKIKYGMETIFFLYLIYLKFLHLNYVVDKSEQSNTPSQGE